jgi:D-aminoacyl-tRNA deacylase
MMPSNMRAVVQRVSRAEVRVKGQVVGSIGRGLLVLVGFSTEDTPETGRTLAEKIVGLRLFDNEQGRMDRSILEHGGGVLVVSQFTLYGDCRKGRRPSYSRAASPENARPLYEAFVNSLRDLLHGHHVSVSEGRFQAMMDVESVNDGPVTLLLDSEKVF